MLKQGVRDNSLAQGMLSKNTDNSEKGLLPFGEYSALLFENRTGMSIQSHWQTLTELIYMSIFPVSKRDKYAEEINMLVQVSTDVHYPTLNIIIMDTLTNAPWQVAETNGQGTLYLDG